MGRGLGKIQLKILSTLEELTKRNRRDWFSLQFVTVFLYTPWQIDPSHGKNQYRLGRFIENWNYERGHHRRVWESCRALEKRGLVECRIVLRDEGKEKGTWGGGTRWMEMKIKNEDERI